MGFFLHVVGVCDGLFIILVLLSCDGRVGIYLVLRYGKHDASEGAVHALGAVCHRHVGEVVVIFHGAASSHHVEESLTLAEQFFAAFVHYHVVADVVFSGRCQLWCAAANLVELCGCSVSVASVERSLCCYEVDF